MTPLTLNGQSLGPQDEFEALERAGSSDRQDAKTPRGRAAIAISVDGAALVSTADHNQHRVEVQHASAKCVQALEVEEPTMAD